MGQCVTSQNEPIEYSTQPNPILCAPVYDGKKVRIETGIYYTGEWKDNKRHGSGVQEWEIGDKYEGQWADDKANGKGKLFFHFGEVYEGSFKDDEPCGYGIYIHNDGSKYVGEWIQSKKHGEGKEIWKDGTQFEGQYVEGLKNGTGVFTWANNSSYKGQFERNQLHGVGEFRWSDGRCYIGQWKNGKMEGRGIYKWPDGRIYEGDYVNDMKEGQGVFTWPDNRRYEGGWLGGNQHGAGIVYFPGEGDAATDVCKSVWNDGKRVAEWKTMDGLSHPWRNLTEVEIKAKEEEARIALEANERKAKRDTILNTPISIKVGLANNTRQVIATLSVPPPLRGYFTRSSEVTSPGLAPQVANSSGNLEIVVGSGVLRVDDGTKFKGEWTTSGKLHGQVEIYPSKQVATQLHLLDSTTGAVKALKAVFVFGICIGIATLPSSVSSASVVSNNLNLNNGVVGGSQFHSNMASNSNNSKMISTSNLLLTS